MFIIVFTIQYNYPGTYIIAELLKELEQGLFFEGRLLIKSATPYIIPI